MNDILRSFTEDMMHFFVSLLVLLVKGVLYLIVALAVTLGFEFTEVGYAPFWESNNPTSEKGAPNLHRLPNGDVIAWIDFVDNRKEVIVKIIKNPTIKEYCNYKWDGKGVRLEKHTIVMKKGKFIQLNGNSRLCFMSSENVFYGKITSSSRLLTMSQEGVFGDVQFQYFMKMNSY